MLTPYNCLKRALHRRGIGDLANLICATWSVSCFPISKLTFRIVTCSELPARTFEGDVASRFVKLRFQSGREREGSSILYSRQLGETS